MPGICLITGFRHLIHMHSLHMLVLNLTSQVLGCKCSPSLHVNIPAKWVHTKMCETAHKCCVKELSFRSSKQSAMKSQSGVWHAQDASKLETITARTYITVYLVGWKHLSFSVHKHLFDFQRHNSLDMENMLILTPKLQQYCTVHYIWDVHHTCKLHMAKLMNEKDVARSSRYIDPLHRVGLDCI